MEATKVTKKFDAVKLMRVARERISAETKNMNAEQLKAYIKKKLAASKMKPTGQ